MLKRVAVSDLEMGMFIHKMEGSWFRHPFWKSRFLLDDPDNLRHLRTSRLASVIIDTSRGRDVASTSCATASAQTASPAPAARATARIQPRVAAIRQRESVDLRSTAPADMARESRAARLVADKGEKVVSRVFVDARLGKTVQMRTVEPLVQDIYASVQRNPHAFSGLMRCKLNNEFVYRHALAVSALMVALARRLQLSPEETREAGQAGLFLDIGTNFLPKDAALHNGDYRGASPDLWRQHVALGARALRDAGNVPEPVIEACLHHHEQTDGAGFPHGLKAACIPRLARMAAICDTFDYLLIDGATAGMDPAAAIAELRRMGDAFDADILRAFIESVGIYPVGSFVRLQSDRLAMVIDEDPDQIDQPVVQPFFSLSINARIRTPPIELAHCFGEDKIVGIADLSGLILPEPAQLRDLIFMQAHKLKR